jgi:hypothetical protein
MSKRSKTILLVAIVYSLVFAGLLGNGLYLISAEGAKLEIAKTQISEHTAKEVAYAKTMSLLEVTRDNRDTLRTFFITENDTITFLTTIESAAKTIGVTLKTNSLAVLPETSTDGVITPSVVEIRFDFLGTQAAVKQFLVLLEHIPYHTAIPAVTLASNGEGGAWSGTAQLRLTLQP